MERVERLGGLGMDDREITMSKVRESGEHAVTEDFGERIYMEDLIMESILGRKLTENETVFHHNSDTLDNRRENLYVVEFGIDSGLSGEPVNLTPFRPKPERC